MNLNSLNYLKEKEAQLKDSFFLFTASCQRQIFIIIAIIIILYHLKGLNITLINLKLFIQFL